MKAISDKPILWPLAALLIAALLLVGVTSSASAGNGGEGAAVTSKKKCKRKSKGHGKASKRKRCRRHRPGRHRPGAKLPAPTMPTVPGVTALAISPSSFDFGAPQHGGFGSCGADPDPNCPTQAFTVTNVGTAPSGPPSAQIAELHNPEIGGPAAFQITSNACNLALAPGASCSITVKFAPNSNAGDSMYSSRLDVSATPGGTASAQLSGTAS